jgi:predicted glycoside hydrolase/deacetylase ChbG (UPF0249 family)
MVERAAKLNAKHIVVCADDFGMSAAINEGIIALAQQARLSAVSCLTQAPALRQDAGRLCDLDVDIGAHLNFTETFTPLGLTMPLPRLIVSTYAHALDIRRIGWHITQQLDAFEAVLGRPPDFVDGHQHVHQLPQIRQVLCALLAKRYAGRLPWLRCSAPGRLDGLSLKLRCKARVIGALGGRTCARIAAAAGLRTNRRLLGVYDFQGGAQAYAQLLPIWLRNACEGDLLMCHPALPGSDDTGMAVQRGAEYQILSQAEYPAWLLRHGLRIGRYRHAEQVRQK